MSVASRCDCTSSWSTPGQQRLQRRSPPAGEARGKPAPIVIRRTQPADPSGVTSRRGKPARCVSSSAPSHYIDSAAVCQRRRRSAVARPTSGRRRTSAAICVTSSPVGSTQPPDHYVAVVPGYTYSPAVVRLRCCRYFSYRQLPIVTASIQPAQINSACRPSWVNGQRLSVLYCVSTAC